MIVKVNGESVTCKESDTMADLIAALQLEGKVMAAAVNMNIVKQDSWNEHQLNDNDVVELLDFVGGG
ncbi:MAG: sulfur carrier protein ThiS [Campylobacterota bacterium]|nr:sulfur carrier protein ThiS [Campylobacterota bacterium]